MVSMQAALAVMVLSSAGDTVLLDFYADWCGPCRAMNPTIEALVERGYPVRKVNVDQDRQLAAKFGVQSVPCYVMLVDGGEVDRVSGSTSFSRLERMCKLAAPQTSTIGLPATVPEPVRPEPRQLPAPGWTPMGNREAADDTKLIAASVRLRIEDPDGHSWGSGTIIDAREGEALILTCAHVFRDSQGKGKIEVDLFGPCAGQRVAGRLISYDLDRDVGLLSIRTPGPVATAPVAPPGYLVGPDSPVVSVGCNNGDRPSARRSRVASLNKVLRPPTLKVAGLPVEGRSGGGLFSAEGKVIGVCYAADPRDGEGLYAALESIYHELDQTKLSYIYRPEQAAPTALAGSPAAGPAVGPVRPVAALVAVDPPPMPKRMPRNADGWSPGGTSEVSLDSTPARQWRPPHDSPQLSAAEQAALDEIRRRLKEGAEVICVVRSRADPNAQSEVIMLDRASPGFLRQLASEAAAGR